MTESSRAHYGSVFWKFFRNSAVREMTFRGNFIITILTRGFWFAAQLTLFEIIFRSVPTINGWSRYEYFSFMATSMLINAIVETFFMPNCANFSELIRTGNLDFALLKPIDTQFLISFEKINLAMMNQVVLALALIGFSFYKLHEANMLPEIGVIQVLLYFALIGAGVTFFYSLMIALASTSVWFGRNQGLYDFWFYVTVFARYPRSIYESPYMPSQVLLFTFTNLLPILVVVTVPAQVLLNKEYAEPGYLMPPVLTAVAAAVVGLIVSRRIFRWSLNQYRSASS